MRLPINDFFAKNGRIREDGRMVHDMYVYEVKKPSESKGEWDYYKLREVIPGDAGVPSAQGQRLSVGQEELTPQILGSQIAGDLSTYMARVFAPVQNR